MTEDERVGWHHLFTGHDLGNFLGDGEGQRTLVCCSPWGQERVARDLVTEQQDQFRGCGVCEEGWGRGQRGIRPGAAGVVGKRS